MFRGFASSVRRFQKNLRRQTKMTVRVWMLHMPVNFSFASKLVSWISFAIWASYYDGLQVRRHFVNANVQSRPTSVKVRNYKFLQEGSISKVENNFRRITS